MMKNWIEVVGAERPIACGNRLENGDVEGFNGRSLAMMSSPGGEPEPGVGRLVQAARLPDAIVGVSREDGLLFHS